MKSMKKLVLAGLVLLASVMVLVGCDTNTGPGSTSGTDNNTGGGATVTPVTVTVTNETFATVLAEVMQKPKSTLSLTEDISVSETIEITDGDFILDLNGHKIEGTKYPVLEIAEDVSLVIQDSGENGCITPTSTASGDIGFPLSVCNNGSLTLTSGSIEVNGEYASGVLNNGDFTMTGGNVIVTESTSDSFIELYGVSNVGTMRIRGGTISVTSNGSATTAQCFGICNNNLLYLSGNPIIKGITKYGVSSQPAEVSFCLYSPITLVGKLSNKYGMESFLKVGETAVVGGEGYILTEDDKAKFELSNKNMELVLDMEQNALVLKETSTN